MERSSVFIHVGGETWIDLAMYALGNNITRYAINASGIRAL